MTLLVRTVLEVVYLAGLGDVSWLPTHRDVHLEPQARAAALVLLVRQPEVAGSGLTRWVFPVWRFSSFEAPPLHPDALDVAYALRGGRCFDIAERRWWKKSLLGPTFEEHARAVWLTRHWSVDEMVDAWAGCVARSLVVCGERLDRPWSASDMIHLWAHQRGGGVTCHGDGVNARWISGVDRVIRAVPGSADSLCAETSGRSWQIRCRTSR